MRKFFCALVLSVLAVGMMGCYGPYQKEMTVDVSPDETAFMLQLEGDTLGSQQKFQSVEFLESKKVAAKRILLPQRKQSMGRMSADYKWIPTAQVLKVSRRPVQREWTDDTNTGTSSEKQSLHVESLDSVGFGVGASIMAHIDEQNAATFVYFFNGQALDSIIDGPIRGFALSQLSEKFGGFMFEKCKSEKTAIFAGARAAITEKFSLMGITIDYFGASQGLTFDNPEIQKGIDQQVMSEARIVAEQNSKLANDQRRLDEIAEAEKEVAISTAKANAAKQLALAKDAMSFEVELFERRQRALALPELAKNFSNIKILPSNSPILMELGLTEK
jgi:hypothetical protein